MNEGTMQRNETRRSLLKGVGALAVAHALPGIALGAADEAGSGTLLAYAGTYTSAADGSAHGEGIYLLAMDVRTGGLTQKKLAATIPNPSWIVLHPSRKYLYAIHEVDDFQGKSGAVSAFAADPSSGELTMLNTVSSEGAGPAHMSLDATGRWAFVANYAGGTIAVLPIGADGRLGAAVDVHSDRGNVGAMHASNAPRGSFAISGHDAPHAHMITADPRNRFVLASDLGQDRIYVYRFDAVTGKLTPSGGTPHVELPSGDGPRHFAFHPNGRWMYSLQEEASTLAFFHYDAGRGALEHEQTISALPDDFAGTNFASEIALSNDGRFLYAANRLHNSITICAISTDGRMRRIGEVSTMGDYPRSFRIDPGGNYLYVCNQRSDSLSTFRIERESGQLHFTGRYTAMGSPACLVFPELIS